MKNRTLRIGLIVAILTLVTSCFMGSTFAKYVTTGNGSDEARVAKWGVTISFADFAKDDAGFYTEYATDDTHGYTGLAVENNLSVDDKNLVAPGTEGMFAAIAVTGTPEVAVRVTYTADLELANWTVNTTEYYCPIAITVKNNTTTTTFNGMDYADMDTFETAVEAAIVAAKMDYEPNENLSTVNDDLVISWAWAYETGADEAAKEANNVKDTALGNAATAATISLAVSCTVTQID